MYDITMKLAGKQAKQKRPVKERKDRKTTRKRRTNKKIERAI